jgi:hypothetical protein
MEKGSVTLNFEFIGKTYPYITCHEDGTLEISDEFAEAIIKKIQPITQAIYKDGIIQSFNVDLALDHDTNIT